MKIRVTLTADELKDRGIKGVPTYKNKDGTYRLYFNSLDEFLDAVTNKH